MTDEKGRWAPDGSILLDAPEVNAVIYRYPIYPIGQRFGAIAYAGNAKKHAWHYTFKSEERFLATANEWRANLKAHADRIAAAKTARTAFVHGLKVGDVLDYAWGYDQTNRDFFEVVATTTKTVTLRPIASSSTGEDGFMSGRFVPLRTKYIGPALNPKLVQPGNYVSMGHGSASKWDGTPKYATWYA